MDLRHFWRQATSLAPRCAWCPTERPGGKLGGVRESHLFAHQLQC